jgi:hypothetical protein
MESLSEMSKKEQFVFPFHVVEPARFLETQSAELAASVFTYASWHGSLGSEGDLEQLEAKCGLDRRKRDRRFQLLMGIGWSLLCRAKNLRKNLHNWPGSA